MRHFILLLTVSGSLGAAGCRQRHDELPGPPISLFEVVPRGSDGQWRTMRGVMEMYLTREKPSRTFWNDLDTQTKPWGTITLKGVEGGGTVVVDFDGRELRAKPGQVFPGTGVKVIASHDGMDTALLRTRWTHTVLPGAE